MTKYRIERLSSADYSLWNKYVDEHPQGTIFHTTSWLSKFSEELFVNVVFDKENVIKGGFAILKMRKYGVVGYHIPPFTPYYGPLISPSKETRISKARTEEHILSSIVLDSLPKAPCYDFTPRSGSFDVIPYLHRGFSSSVYYTNKIRGSIDDYYSLMSRSKRKDINKLKKMVDDKTIIFSKTDNLDDLVSLAYITSKHKSFYLKIKYLKKIFRTDTSEEKFWNIYLVRQPSGEPIAGLLTVFDNSCSYGLLNGSVRDGRLTAPGRDIICLDFGIRQTLELGKTFDLCGSVLPGVEELWRHFGGIQEPCYRLQKSRSPFYFSLRTLKQFFHERKR